MQLIHRIAHLLSRLLAVGSAYIYIYIYQVVTRFYFNSNLNMGYAYISPLAPVDRLQAVMRKNSMLHLIVWDEPQAVWSLAASVHRVRMA